MSSKEDRQDSTRPPRPIAPLGHKASSAGAPAPRTKAAKLTEPELLALVTRWLIRANEYTQSAMAVDAAINPGQVSRNMAMAVTLKWAANDLCVTAGIDFNAALVDQVREAGK